ncbi:MAG: UDP-glucose/GDP-mannose dehydrogenase family protein [Candidatus Korobacteraceae bacterium]
MQIAILGCGYVGLVSGACLAEIGHSVVCTDNDESKIRVLKTGELPIYEPYLREIVARNVASQRLTFTADLGAAVRHGDVVFICVGTPPLPDGDADLSAIDSAARLIAVEARSSKLVVEKSTVPMQTGQKLTRALAIYGRSSKNSFSVASNPEFLREGTAVQDFLHPDRIVIGVSDEVAERQLREIYRPILQQSALPCPIHDRDCPIREIPVLLVTSINSAELIKHACNSFLAVKISYANLIADVCETMGADGEEVMRAMGLDPRIGAAFLAPGLGFGGFCLPKDIQAFIRLGEKAGVDVSLLKDAELINKRRIDHFLSKATQWLWTLKDKRIGVLGLSFKPNTDDIRFAPAMELIGRLLQEHAQVRVYDPQAMAKTRELFPAIHYGADPYEVAEGSEALMIVTEWECFRELDWPRIRNVMQRPLVLDGRNLLNGREMVAMGFEYQGVGVLPPESWKPEAAQRPEIPLAQKLRS